MALSAPIVVKTDLSITVPVPGKVSPLSTMAWTWSPSSRWGILTPRRTEPETDGTVVHNSHPERSENPVRGDILHDVPVLEGHIGLRQRFPQVRVVCCVPHCPVFHLGRSFLPLAAYSPCIPATYRAAPCDAVLASTPPRAFRRSPTGSSGGLFGKPSPPQFPAGTACARAAAYRDPRPSPPCGYPRPAGRRRCPSPPPPAGRRSSARCPRH